MTTWKDLGEFLLKRLKNPQYIGTALVLLGSQVLVYWGFNLETFTSWSMVWELIQNTFATPAIWFVYITQLYAMTVSFDTTGVLDGTPIQISSK